MNTSSNEPYQPTDEDIIKSFDYFIYYLKCNQKPLVFEIKNNKYELYLMPGDCYLYLDIEPENIPITELLYENNSHEKFLSTFLQKIPLEEKAARALLYKKFLEYPRQD